MVAPTDPVPAEGSDAEATPPTTVTRELLFGVIGGVIAIGCFLPPLVHFVSGPLGPGIGGFFAARQVKPAARGAAIIAASVGSVVAGLLAILAGAILAFSTHGKPSWFPDTATVAAIIAGVWVYAAALAGVGVFASSMFDQRTQ